MKIERCRTVPLYNERVTTVDAMSADAFFRELDAFDDGRVELDVERQVAGICKSGAQSAAIDAVEGQGISLPSIGRACRRGEGLIVIEKDVVAVDVL